MFLRDKSSMWLLPLLALVIFAASDSRTESRSVGDDARSLDTLKSLDYAKVENGKTGETVGYFELKNIILACEAYARGVTMLPRFHEPVLTRGDTGVSVFRQVSPSVVLVVTGNVKDDKVTDVGFGAGVIIEPSGYVLTNWHVITGYEAGVIFLKPATGATPEKNKAYVVTLVAQDEKADLALLKIVKPPAGLPTVQFGDISMIQVAEDVHIIGHPHGELWSYSTGVISQIRDNYDWKYSDGSKHLAKVLQLQTAINPGNSGGPVLDNTSKMLGLVSMSKEGQNLNYAVAIDVIKSFVARSMAVENQGSGVGSQGEKGEFYAGHTNSGLVVTKAVYSDCVSYTTRDPKGSVVAVLVHTASGAILTASEPNAFGGFRDWSYKLPDGGVVVVTSDGLMPELVSAGARE